MSTEPNSTEFFRKLNNLKDPLKLETKGKICEFGFILILHFGNMCITLMSLSLVCYFLCVWFKVCFLLGDKQEAKFWGVMSAQKHSLQTRDFARFGIDFIYIYDRVLINFLIFSFIGFL